MFYKIWDNKYKLDNLWMVFTKSEMLEIKKEIYTLIK